MLNEKIKVEISIAENQLRVESKIEANRLEATMLLFVLELLKKQLIGNDAKMKELNEMILGKTAEELVILLDKVKG